MSHSAQGKAQNQLLASLPSEDLAFLASISRSERPSQGRTLTGRSTPASEIWFPHAGAVALIATDSGGRSVQTGVIGREGGVGLEAIFGNTSPLPDSVVQVEGVMTVIPADALRTAMFVRPAIQVALLRFMYVLSAQSLQTIACNRLHNLTSRCCRWLLTLQDRVDLDDLPLTQENLATLLGSGRPRINALLGTLEERELIRRHRGRIRLLTRSGLEACCCECYDATRHSGASVYLSWP